MKRALPHLSPYRLTVLVGVVAGLVGGLANSYVWFDLVSPVQMTLLGYVFVVAMRGAILGGFAGWIAGLVSAEWMKPPFKILAAIIAGVVCGSLAIYLPIPFHVPPEIMDLLFVPESLPSP